MRRGGLQLALAGALLLTVAPAAAREEAALRTTVGALVGSPDAHDGTKVQVRAEVERVTTPHVFTLDEDEIGAGPDLIVLVPPPQRAQVEEGAQVIVVGTLRRLTRAELQGDYEGLHLASEQRAELESRPVLVASAVRVPEGADLLAAGPAPPARASPGALARQPHAYAGREVTVLANVADVLSPTVFTLDEDRLLAGPDVLVLLPRAAARPIRAGASLTVTGEVRRFQEEEIERDYGWLDLAPELAADFHGRAVIIASEVRSAAGEALYGD